MSPVEWTVMDEERRSRPCALVIEDDSIVRALVAEILRTAGYRVYEAEDGADGIVQARVLFPALVVTDIFMPVQDGIEVLRHLKREMPQTRVVAISGGSPRVPLLDMLAVATKLGADAIVAKPFTPVELLTAASADDRGLADNVVSLNAFRRKPSGRPAQLPSKV
ncbi:response regulator transcription factor [Dongia rigui]|uniref:Response regulator n=1 Tax=Dongia rigui TaxID=940149 RepID=A0ABU5DW08_9PROT|nr:response regulator [Dongia rigui]MDY0871482.1 response regulator [Dongia rigui]